MEVEPARDPVSGVWFFSSYVMTSLLPEGTKTKEKATVKTAELNRGIDPAVFTWAGLNIRAGTPVKRYADHDTISFNGYWDGTREVVDKEYRKRPEYKALQRLPLPSLPVGEVPAAGIQVWQYILAGLLAAAGAYAVVRAIRR